MDNDVFICPNCGTQWNKDIFYQKSLNNQNFIYMISTGGDELENCCFKCGYVEKKIDKGIEEYEKMIDDEYMAHMDTRD